jgi:endonuclease/exonuclease/phosphatase family metal-dependent hydrolase
MRIIFLNVWGESMRDELVDYIAKEAPTTDVFCFQEANDEVKQRCKDTLKDYVEQSEYKFLDEDNDFPQSTFIKKGIEILSQGTLLEDEPDCGLILYTEIKVSDKSLYICNVHGTARPGDKLDTPERLKQSRTVINFFKDKNDPIVIGGDFNTNLETESISMFSSNGYRDLIKEFEIKTTRNHFAWDRWPTKMYYSDYVFLNDEVTLKSFEVIDNEVSDHLPLILDVEV